MFWLGIIASLCYVPGVTGAYIATQWPVLAVALSFALWRSGPFTWLHGLGVLFIAYAALRAPFSPLPEASVFGLWLVVIMGLCVWLGTTATTLRDLYAGLAVGAAVSSAIAVGQYFGFNFLPTTSTTLPGLYLNGVQQGTVLALLAVALISERMWLWALPLVPGIALSGSRGAWIALAVGLLACGVRRLWVLGAVAAAGAFYLLTPLSSSDAHRLFIWRTAWDNLTPLGLGPGMFYTLLMQRGGETFFPEYAHNDALQLVFEYGAGAALPLAIFAFALCRTRDREWPVIAAFVAAGCYSMPLFMPVASLLALACVGRVLRTYAVARGYGGNSGFHGVPWRCNRTQASGATVSVAPHH